MLPYLENGVIKDFEMRSFWIILVNPNCLVRVSREKLEEEQTQTHRGGVGRQRQGLEWCGYKPRNSQGCWQPPGAWRQAWSGFSHRAPEGAWSCWHFEFGLLASKVVREQVSFLLSPKVSDHLLWQPQETTTVGKYERFFFLILQILTDHWWFNAN